MEIFTERFMLKILDSDFKNLENYLRWMQDVESNPFIEGVNVSTTKESLVRYIAEKKDLKHALFFGIFTKDNFEHIGNVKLEPLIRGQSATVGILIGEEKWRRKGVGFEILTELLRYSFTELGLKKVDLGVDKQNSAAINLYKKVGFKTIELSSSSCSITMELTATSWVSRRI
jgi:RimJ/RimL family protein N-acetyltransferase